VLVPPPDCSTNLEHVCTSQLLTGFASLGLLFAGNGKDRLASPGSKVKDEVEPKIEQLESGSQAELGPIKSEQHEAGTTVKAEPASPEKQGSTALGKLSGKEARRSARVAKPTKD
jgi:hypothetical protein